MNLLVLGNGFDLAHGLPTAYKDFLRFAKLIRIARTGAFRGKSGWMDLKRVNIEERGWQLREEILSEVKQLYEGKEKSAIADRMIELMKKNIWYEYFLELDGCEGDRSWIDFETEISMVIQSLAIDGKEEEPYQTQGLFLGGDGLADGSVKEEKRKKFIHVVSRCDGGWKGKDEAAPHKIDFQGFVNLLEHDLNRLIHCLELYLIHFVEQIPLKGEELLPDVAELSIDKVLSFNYTHTYQRYYQVNDVEYHYIHGETKAESIEESSNLVIGIDEYHQGELRDLKSSLTVFKKFFQRIHRRTGNRYKDWISEIRRGSSMENGETDPHHIYVFGHSLDVTDRDVLRELMTMERTVTTVFYHSKEGYANQIKNLVEVLGQDQLIEMVYAADPSIVFQQQSTGNGKELSSRSIEIRRDIYRLHRIYLLNDKEAEALVQKIQDRINAVFCTTSQSAEALSGYFVDQKWILSLYNEWERLFPQQADLTDSFRGLIVQILNRKNCRILRESQCEFPFGITEETRQFLEEANRIAAEYFEEQGMDVRDLAEGNVIDLVMAYCNGLTSDDLPRYLNELFRKEFNGANCDLSKVYKTYQYAEARMNFTAADEGRTRKEPLDFIHDRRIAYLKSLCSEE